MLARSASRRRVAVASAVVALLFAACGTDEDASPVAVESGSPQSEEQPSSTETGASEASSSEITEPETPPDSVDPDVEAAQPQPSDESAESSQPQEQDPLFYGEFASLDGTTLDIADFTGTDVVLWFWAPW